MWIDAVPTQPACGSRGNGAWAAEPQTSSCAPLIQKPLRDAAITVNAAVAQKWPVASDIFKMFQIALADQDLFLVVRCFHDDPPERIAEKRSAPEFQSLARSAAAADVTKLVAYSIDHADKYAVSDSVCALDGAPGVVLHGAKLGFLIRMPADGSGIKKNVGALQSGEARTFGIPLVPADESAHASVFCVKSLEAKVAGREVKLFVVKRVVRDVHLAIEAFGAAIGVKDDCRVVIETARAAFKDRNHDGSFGFASDCGERFRRWSGHRLRQVKEGRIFTLAEILRAEKLRQAHHLRALLGGGANFLHGATNVVVGVGGAVHLDQADSKDVWIGHHFLRIAKIAITAKIGH